MTLKQIAEHFGHKMWMTKNDIFLYSYYELDGLWNDVYKKCCDFSFCKRIEIKFYLDDYNHDVVVLTCVDAVLNNQKSFTYDLHWNGTYCEITNEEGVLLT